MIDAHCHLDFFPENDLAVVVKRAMAAGIHGAVLGGVWHHDALRLTNWSSNKAFCQSHNLCFANRHVDLVTDPSSFLLFASLGLHPWYQWEKWTRPDESLDVHKMEADFREIETILNHNPSLFWAVGETGIDLAKIPSSLKQTRFSMQKAAFEFCIDLAKQRNLPLIVHTRNAWKATLEILSKSKSPEQRILFHCYGGSAESLFEIEAEGVFASFGGVATWKTAVKAKEAARQCPKTMLVLETDAPDLAPELPDGTRPERNEPALLKEITATIASLRHELPQQTAEVSDRNIQRLLGLRGF